MFKIVRDYDKCSGESDKICIELCPSSVFQSENSEKPVVINATSCILCKICQFNCPSQAISIFV